MPRTYYDETRGLWIIFGEDSIEYSAEPPETTSSGQPVLVLSAFVGSVCPFRCRYCYNQQKQLVDPAADEEPGYLRALRYWPHEEVIVLGGEPALYRRRVEELLAIERTGRIIAVDTAVPRPWCPRCLISVFDDDEWMKQVTGLPAPPRNAVVDVKPTLSPRKILRPRPIKTEYYGDVDPHAPSRWSVGHTFYTSSIRTHVRYENCMSPKLGPRGEVYFCESVFQIFQSAYEPPLPVPYAWVYQETVDADSARCGVTQLLMLNRIYIENPGPLSSGRGLLGEAETGSAESGGEARGEPGGWEGLGFSG